ncbi:hypothetical protein SAMN05444166_0190 [Singulisphaera sp. GP187]|uniref:hypothetical protein n=1 Tax=Singulisphaera sp. GP187 TaxID=1882752 RepID=UPI00092AA287|nr:hypothetical protein [Singulisphaera sp. GP187]SIN69605.1 hypothetical protein SAMN05444166_0190 [Singulisphaera sp. GP187]
MIPANPTIPRTDLTLPRILALILFNLAAFMGLPTAAVALVSLFSGNWRVVLLTALVWPIVGMVVWLGRMIWSGRSIPTWFSCAVGGLISAGPAVGLLIHGEWMGAMGSLALFCPFMLMFWPRIGVNDTKPVKTPKAFDDEFF